MDWEKASQRAEARSQELLLALQSVEAETFAPNATPVTPPMPDDSWTNVHAEGALLAEAADDAWHCGGETWATATPTTWATASGDLEDKGKDLWNESLHCGGDDDTWWGGETRATATPMTRATATGDSEDKGKDWWGESENTGYGDASDKGKDWWDEPEDKGNGDSSDKGMDWWDEPADKGYGDSSGSKDWLGEPDDKGNGDSSGSKDWWGDSADKGNGDSSGKGKDWWGDSSGKGKGNGDSEDENDGDLRSMPYGAPYGMKRCHSGRYGKKRGGESMNSKWHCSFYAALRSAGQHGPNFMKRWMDSNPKPKVAPCTGN